MTAFYFWKMIMKKTKTICYPQCESAVIHYDGRSKIDRIANCKKRRKRTIYHVDSGKTKIKPIFPRNCSSGITFY